MISSTIKVLEQEVRACLTVDKASLWRSWITALDELRKTAAEGLDEENADRAWFLQTVAEARGGMVDAFKDIKSENYKGGWDKLEQAELRVADLRRNQIYCLNDFRINDLGEMVRQWQALFPYRVFASPELIIKHEECSICGEQTGPWSTCSHMVGKVYCGRMCCRMVTKVDLVSVSLVFDPVQKYSAIIPYTKDGKDPMDYRRLKWVAEHVNNPFAIWHAIETSKLFPHSRFTGLLADDPCPCESGFTYRLCCMNLDGIRMPHTAVHFVSDPPENTSDELFVYKSHSDN